MRGNRTHIGEGEGATESGKMKHAASEKRKQATAATLDMDVAMKVIKQVQETLSKWTVAELKAVLKEQGLKVRGNKALLVARLAAHMQQWQQEQAMRRNHGAPRAQGPDGGQPKSKAMPEGVA